MTSIFVLEQLQKYIQKRRDGSVDVTADERNQLFAIVVLAGRYILNGEITRKQLQQLGTFSFGISVNIEKILDEYIPIPSLNGRLELDVARRQTIDFVRNTKYIEELGRCLSYDERIHIVAFHALYPRLGSYTLEDVKSLIECVSLPPASSVSVLSAAT